MFSAVCGIIFTLSSSVYAERGRSTLEAAQGVDDTSAEEMGRLLKALVLERDVTSLISLLDEEVAIGLDYELSREIITGALLNSSSELWCRLFDTECARQLYLKGIEAMNDPANPFDVRGYAQRFESVREILTDDSLQMQVDSYPGGTVATIRIRYLWDGEISSKGWYVEPLVVLQRKEGRWVITVFFPRNL